MRSSRWPEEGRREGRRVERELQGREEVPRVGEDLEVALQVGDCVQELDEVLQAVAGPERGEVLRVGNAVLLSFCFPSLFWRKFFVVPRGAGTTRGAGRWTRSQRGLSSAGRLPFLLRSSAVLLRQCASPEFVTCGRRRVRRGRGEPRSDLPRLSASSGASISS